MTKKLNVAQITSELEGSAFFPTRRPPARTSTSTTGQPAIPAADDVMTSKRQNVMRERGHDVKTSEQPISTLARERPQGRLDLNETPHKDFTLRLTDAEYEALDDLEREIRRRFGITTSKNNLIRCGIHFLVEDHAYAKAESVALKKLQTKPVTP